jgi:RimJ/RimL family protein N-acetyltransferase
VTQRPLSVEPIVLEGDHVRLEPMTLEHLPGLVEIGLALPIWTWMPFVVRTPDDLRGLVESALRARDAGAEFPFVTVQRASGQPVGSARYLAIALEHARLEIGWTWLAPAWQRSVVNTEAKLLMLGHAFEALGCRRVEFKTDAQNEASRRALVGIGAVFEGVFRKHMLVRGGERRDSAWYSITDDEWPDVRTHLRARLARDRI